MPHNPYAIGREDGPPSLPDRAPPAPDRQPVAHLVLGIIGIVLAGLGFIGAIYSILQNYALPVSDPFQRAMRFPSWYFVPALVLGLALTVWLLVGSIRLLRPTEAARRSFVLYCICYIAFCVLGSIYPLIHIDHAIEVAGPEMAPPMRPLLAPIAYVFFVGSQVLGLVYPVISLIVLSRPSLREWIADRQAPASATASPAARGPGDRADNDRSP